MASSQQPSANAANASSALAFTTPTVPISMPMSVIAQQPRYLLNRSNVAFGKLNSARNCDILSLVKSSSIDIDKNKDSGQQNASAKEQNKKPFATSQPKSNTQGNQSGRGNRNVYSSTNAAGNSSSTSTPTLRTNPLPDKRALAKPPATSMWLLH